MAVANKYFPTSSKDKYNNIGRIRDCSNIWKFWQIQIQAKTRGGRVK
jgi:hypothetical protein